MPYIGDTWNCATGIYNGMPQLVRCRMNLDQIARVGTHQRLLRITWKYAINDQSGLPSVDVNERMAVFENAIVGELERDLLGIIVSVCVCNGIKEWSAYVSDAQRTCDRLNRALESYEPFPVQMTVEDDATWQAYQSLLENLRPE